MISNELNAVLIEIRDTQKVLNDNKHLAEGHRKNENLYRVAAEEIEKEIKGIEALLDTIQIKLRNTIIADDNKYGIKGPTVIAPAEPETIQIGREG